MGLERERSLLFRVFLLDFLIQKTDEGEIRLCAIILCLYVFLLGRSFILEHIEGATSTHNNENDL